MSLILVFKNEQQGKQELMQIHLDLTQFLQSLSKNQMESSLESFPSSI